MCLDAFPEPAATIAASHTGSEAAQALAALDPAVVGEDRLRDVSASLSAIRALLSPEQRHDSAEPIAEAKSDSKYDVVLSAPLRAADATSMSMLHASVASAAKTSPQLATNAPLTWPRVPGLCRSATYRSARA